ncbi:MAG: hypothetical protein ACMXYE_00525 [Candidatus Woesearchaeota archaeon]
MKTIHILIVVLIALCIPLVYASIAAPICGSEGEIFLISNSTYIHITEQIDSCGPESNTVYLLETIEQPFSEGELVWISTQQEVCSPTPLGEVGCNQWEEWSIMHEEAALLGWRDEFNVTKTAIQCETIEECHNQLDEEKTVRIIPSLDNIKSYIFIFLILIILAIIFIFFILKSIYNAFKFIIKVVFILAIIAIIVLLWLNPALLLSYF